MDPRILLYGCLVKKGCKPKDAHLISADAGGNIFVDEKYLIDFGISDKKERKKYLKSLAKNFISQR
jgi:hypothetical protein